MARSPARRRLTPHRCLTSPGEPEEGPDLPFEVVGLTGYRPIRNPNHATAGPLDPGITTAIGLERMAVAVEGPAVELDDEALLGPETVDRVASDGDVDRRDQEFAVAAVTQEPPLEVGAGLGKGEGRRPQQGTEFAGAGSPCGVVTDPAEFLTAQQPSALGLVESLPKGSWGDPRLETSRCPTA